MHLKDALEVISNISDNECPPQITNQFANLCIQLAISYLRLLEKKGKRIRETADESEFSSIAADCIADLFAGGQGDQLDYFRKFFHRLKEEQIADADLFIALRRLIFKRVQQHLTKIYAQRDPDGAKLIRNIRLAIRRHEELSLSKDSTGSYILFFDGSDHPIARPSAEIIAQAFHAIYRSALTIDMLVRNTFTELHKIYNSSIEVRISEFAKLIRFARQLSSAQSPVYQDEKILSYLHKSDLEKEIASLISSIRMKVKKKYVTADKVTAEQGEAMMLAIEDMAKDALEGDRLEENFAYLNRYWNELTKNQYYNSIRKIFEYLVRQFKDGIRDFIHSNSE